MQQQNITPTPEQIATANELLKNAKDISCKECGGLVFSEGLRLKTISRLLTGGAKDSLIPIPTSYCIRCNRELLPEDIGMADPNNLIV